MKVGLFIPCYIDQFYPHVGIATFELLTKLGCEVNFPQEQTCCGQPLANSGMEKEAIPIYKNYIKTFSNYKYIVVPSGSCVYHIRHHYSEEAKGIAERTFELSEFLLNIVNINKLESIFPHKIGIHQSCHGLRGLRLGKSSERRDLPFSNYHKLLSMVQGIEIMELDRVDECCGFGGTFSVNEEAISVKMGKDRVGDHQRNEVEVITSGDMSCLIHLEGIIRREKLNIQIKHIAEILNGTTL